jgi:hypothetical protein
MGKTEGTTWVLGTIVVLTIVFYSVGGFAFVASAFNRIMNPTPTPPAETSSS